MIASSKNSEPRLFDKKKIQEIKNDKMTSMKLNDRNLKIKPQIINWPNKRNWKEGGLTDFKGVPDKKLHIESIRK